MIEELFEDADISFVVPEEELMYTVIEERYLVGEVMAVGHIGRVHSGKISGKELLLSLSSKMKLVISSITN